MTMALEVVQLFILGVSRKVRYNTDRGHGMPQMTPPVGAPPGRRTMQKKRQDDADRKPATTRFPLLAVAVVGGLFAALGVSYWLLGHEGVHPLWLIGVAAIISIALPVLRANFFPSAKDCTSEYTFHEKRLKEQIRRQIAEKLGAAEIGRLYSRAGTFRDSAIDRCRELIHADPARNDPELRFALLLALARIYEHSGEPGKSIQHLTEAIDIEPHHFIANFRLAMNHEWMGDNPSAVLHYRQALGDPGGLSRAMEKLAVAQMERIRKGES